MGCIRIKRAWRKGTWMDAVISVTEGEEKNLARVVTVGWEGRAGWKR